MENPLKQENADILKACFEAERECIEARIETDKVKFECEQVQAEMSLAMQKYMWTSYFGLIMAFKFRLTDDDRRF